MSSVAVPLPALPIVVRAATHDDIPFIDALQKRYAKALGFFPRKQLEGYIDNAWALVAEVVGSQGSEVLSEDGLRLLTPDARLPTSLGYVLSRDRYLKRDELGVIYQLCVAPGAQRGLIGASLIRAVFDRSAYGCRLYCCWCAQDLAANRFWEALGFHAIAFRGGSAKKSRTHIFWQKRVRADATPWWFPAKTDGGAIREDRIVLPIPPGLHWGDAMPVLPPDVGRVSDPPSLTRRDATVGPPREARGRPENRATSSSVRPLGRPTFALPAPEAARAPKAKAKRVPRKHDPALVRRARELRDRWLEQINNPANAGAARPALAGRAAPALPMIDATPADRIAA